MTTIVRPVNAENTSEAFAENKKVIEGYQKTADCLVASATNY